MASHPLLLAAAFLVTLQLTHAVWDPNFKACQLLRRNTAGQLIAAFQGEVTIPEARNQQEIDQDPSKFCSELLINGEWESTTDSKYMKIDYPSSFDANNNDYFETHFAKNTNIDPKTTFSINRDTNDATKVLVCVKKLIDRDGATKDVTDDIDILELKDMECKTKDTVQPIVRFSLTITMEDINDNPPIFIFPVGTTSYEVKIKENEVGRLIYNDIRSDDLDANQNKVPHYTVTKITNSLMTNTAGLFSFLRPTIGEVTSSGMPLIDFERIKSNPVIMVEVTAVDNHDNPADRNTATTTLKVTVEDIDDQNPAFVIKGCTPVPNALDPENCFAPIYKASSLGKAGNQLTITPEAIKAKDLDTLNYEIVYGIAGVDPTTFNGAVAIDSKLGTMNMTRNVERRNAPNGFTVLISASEKLPATAGRRKRQAQELKTTLATVLVKVEPSNSNPPVVTATSTTGYVQENRQVGTVVSTTTQLDVNMQLVITDADLLPGDTQDYDIVLSNTGFTVDSKYNIRTAQTFDYESLTAAEKTNGITFQATVTEKIAPASAAKSAVITLNVRILDMNDNAPVFNPTTASVDIPERGYTPPAAGNVYGPNTVSDADTGVNGQVEFTISSVSNNGGAKFRLATGVGNPMAFRLEVIGTVVRGEQYTINVKAEDKAAAPELRLSSTLPVTVKVVAASNLKPTFPAAEYNVKVSEGELKDTGILTVTASDPEGGALTYSIVARNPVQNTNPDFAINSNTGEITVQRNPRLDREAVASYDLTVQARDSAAQTATTVVKITVTDINDNTPVFSNVPTAPISVAENANGAVVINQMTATDNDIGNNKQITFRLAPGQPMFTINPTDGKITTTQGLDRETTSSYKITVLAVDGGTSPRTGTATLSVTVTDVDDNVPVFAQTSYTTTVLEGRNNEEVIKIPVLDRDQTPTVAFRILSTTSGTTANADTFFSITNTPQNDPAGVIRTIKAIDYENDPRTFILVISTTQAAGTNNPQLTSTVTVNVLDVNDNPPVFQPARYAEMLNENVPLNIKVVQLTATDADTAPQNKDIYYTISNVQPTSGNDLFQIGIKSGKMVTAGDLTRVTSPNVFTVTVKGENLDPATPSMTSTAIVTVTITRNTATPSFAPNPLSITRKETDLRTPNTLLQKYPAVDSDPSPFNIVRYFTQGDAAGENFFTFHNNADIRTTKDLTTDPSLNYRLVVVAEDGGGQRGTGTVSITIERNLNDPVFQGTGTGNKEFRTNTILDYQAPGQVFYTVPVQDVDVQSPHKTVECTMIGDAAATPFFRVDEGTCGISLIKTLVGETPTEYKVLVTAKDKGVPNVRTATATATVTIPVDRNLQTPIFFSKVYYKTIDSNQPTATSFMKVSATDSDTSNNFKILKYSMPGELDGPTYFQVNNNNGDISLKSSLQKVPNDTFTLRVQAQDNGQPPRTAYCLVFITVRRNFNRPIWPSPLPKVTRPVRAHEPVDQVFHTVTATDADTPGTPESKVFYKLVGDADALKYFGIKPVGTGAGIYVRTALTPDVPKPSYNLEIRAYDGAKNSLSSNPNAKLTVNVCYNFNAPNFVNPPKTRVPTINTPNSLANSPKPLTTMTTTDADRCLNTIMYSIDGYDNAQNFFEIGPRNGQITLKSSIDAETKTLYQLRVVAQDNGIPPLRSVAIVEVPVNRNPTRPSFDTANLNKRVTILEIQSTATPIETVTATDPDRAPYNVASYSIVGDGTVPSYFSINNNGQVFVKNMLYTDLSRLGTYEVKIRATDGGGLSTSGAGDVTLTVTVLRNNFTPNFASFTRTLSGSTKQGDLVYTVAATDGDTRAEFNTVRYRLLGTTKCLEYFSINPTDGKITARKNLDDLNQDQVRLQVEASDNGIPSKTFVGDVTFTLDQNLNDPIWVTPGAPTYSLTTANIPETAGFNTVVATVSARDSDRFDPNNRVSYKLVGDPTALNFFKVDPTNGQITPKTALYLDTSATSKYQLKLEASDGGKTPRKAKPDATVAVTVIRNKNAPSFGSNLPATKDLKSNEPNGTPVHNVVVSDSDPSPFNTVTCKLIGDGSAPTLFTLDANNRVTLTGTLEDKPQTEYTIRVKCCDYGTPPKCTVGTITVKVNQQNVTDDRDCDQNPAFVIKGCTPVPNSFDPENCLAPIYKATSPGRAGNQLTITPEPIKAKDLDTMNYEIVYGIAGVEPSTFAGAVVINPKLGTMTMTRNVKRKDAPNGFIVLITAAEKPPGATGGQKLKTTVATVLVAIERSNFNPPVVTATSTTGFVEENRQPGTVVMTTNNLAIIMQLIITDDDLLPGDTQDYDIVLSSTFFTVDSNYNIRTAQALDYEALTAPEKTNGITFQATVTEKITPATAAKSAIILLTVRVRENAQTTSTNATNVTGPNTVTDANTGVNGEGKFNGSSLSLDCRKCLAAFANNAMAVRPQVIGNVIYGFYSIFLFHFWLTW